MADLEGPLASLRGNLHIAVGRFIDDDGRADRARRAIIKINIILSRDDVTGTDNQVSKIRIASEKIAIVKAGKDQKFDKAMESVEAALKKL